MGRRERGRRRIVRVGRKGNGEQVLRNGDLRASWALELEVSALRFVNSSRSSVLERAASLWSWRRCAGACALECCIVDVQFYDERH